MSVFPYSEGKVKPLKRKPINGGQLPAPYGFSSPAVITLPHGSIDIIPAAANLIVFIPLTLTQKNSPDVYR